MITFKQYIHIIEEGGAYGHMANMYENTDLTFVELKDLVSKLFNQGISTVKEKTDGQALAITIKPDEHGELKTFFARNAGHVKNGSTTALTLDEVENKFQGRGNLSDAFIFAARDISKALEGLNNDVLQTIFLSDDGDIKGEWGHRWLHIEIIWPETSNVIQYGKDIKRLIIHNYTEHDHNGTAIGSDFNQTAEYLVDQLGTAAKQDNFEIDYMPILNLPDIMGADDKVGEYVKYFDDLKSKWGLDDGDTVGDLYKAIYSSYIINEAKAMGYDIGSAIINDDIPLLDVLVNRWVYKVKQPAITAIKNQITDDNFKGWVVNHEQESSKWSELNIRNTIKIPFIKVAIDILGGMIPLFIASDKEHSQNDIIDRLNKTRDHFTELASTTSDVKELATIEKINKEMQYLEQTGGLSNALPTEGLTFTYNDTVYKLTGTFAPINQILGQEPGRFAEMIASPNQGKGYSRHDWTSITGPF
jgi:hypothetical protein